MICLLIMAAGISVGAKEYVQARMYIKLNDEIGDWAGDIRKSKLPDSFVVDYVRVYEIVDE